MNAPTFKANQLPQGEVAHVVGSKDPELWHRTIPNIFKDTVYRFANREAAVFPEQEIRWTWAALDREVDALAHGLLELGLQKGDRVGIWSPNRYEWLLTQFATARIGIILVTINPAYRVSEVEFALNKVGCKLSSRHRISRPATISACFRIWRQSFRVASREHSQQPS